MKTVFAVPWIEVESGWGERPEGYAIFEDRKTCVKKTKAASKRGVYKGGYCGPNRPMVYYEIPWSVLTAKLKKELKETGRAHSENHWKPKMKGDTTYIS